MYNLEGSDGHLNLTYLVDFKGEAQQMTHLVFVNTFSLAHMIFVALGYIRYMHTVLKIPHVPSWSKSIPVVADNILLLLTPDPLRLLHKS